MAGRNSYAIVRTKDGFESCAGELVADSTQPSSFIIPTACSV